MPRPLLTERPEWLALQRHFEQVRNLHLRDLFAADPDGYLAMEAHADFAPV